MVSASKSNTGGIVSVELPIASAYRRIRRILSVQFILLGLCWIVSRWPPMRAQDFIDVLWLILGVSYFWRSFVHDVLSVSTNDLRLRTTCLGLHWTRTYPLRDVANLRVDQRRYRACLAFDYRGHRKFIGRQLDLSSLDSLLEQVYRRFPEIAPEVLSVVAPQFIQPHGGV